MTKNQYIGNYLDRKMKNHNLPYGMAYYTLLYKMEEQAEKAWERYKKKLNNPLILR